MPFGWGSPPLFYLAKLLAPTLPRGHCEHLLLPGPDEPAPDGELHGGQGGHRRPDPCPGSEPGGPGAGQLHLPGWIDTDYTVYEGADAAQHPALPGGKPDGHRQHGVIPVLRQGGLHHRGRTSASTGA